MNKEFKRLFITFILVLLFFIAIQVVFFLANAHCSLDSKVFWILAISWSITFSCYSEIFRED